MFAIFAFAYPILVYFGLGILDIRAMAAVLLGVIILRSAVIPNTKAIQKWGILAGTAIIAVLVFMFNDPLYLKLYPVMMSALMLGIFSASLIAPPSIVETFARLQFKGKDLPAYVVVYSRRVTKIWCGFFAMNGLIALYTVILPIEIWTIYNGCISYLLMGCLFAGEFLFRHFMMKKRNDND